MLNLSLWELIQHPTLCPQSRCGHRLRVYRKFPTGDAAFVTFGPKLWSTFPHRCQTSQLTKNASHISFSIYCICLHCITAFILVFFLFLKGIITVFVCLFISWYQKRYLSTKQEGSHTCVIRT